MATTMRQLIDNPRAREVVPYVLGQMDEFILAIQFLARKDTIDLPRSLGKHLRRVATVLEQAAITPGIDLRSPNVMDFATALRIYGPPEFRRGEPLEWELYPSGSWWATDERGADSEIAEAGESFGITIARWDRPDWYVETHELAKSLAAEVVARPSFLRELMEEDFGEADLPCE